MSRQGITSHEGKKYLRAIRSCVDGKAIQVDVYDVLKAFGVQSHPIGHAVKKLLCAGRRGKGSSGDDLRGAIAAINRALDEEEADFREWLANKDKINKETHSESHPSPAEGSPNHSE